MKPETETYGRCYYQRYGGMPYEKSEHWIRFFGGIADRIAAEIGPRRVLDAGCALGFFVEAMRDRGIEAFGVDGSEYAIAHVPEAVRPFCWHGSVTDALREQYDVIVCLEVLEHLTREDGEQAIANLCAHTRDILFSSSPTHYSEATHLNTQPPEYWAAQFARHAFYRDIDFDASFIAPWAVRFRHRTDPPARIVADYERAFARLAIERNELRNLAVSAEAEIASLSEGKNAAAELAHARDTITRMERSWFWRARRPWAWLSRLFGRH